MTPILLLILALLAVAGAVFLWRAAQTQEAAQQRSLAERDDSRADSLDAADAPSADTEPETEPETWGKAEAPSEVPEPDPSPAPDIVYEEDDDPETAEVDSPEPEGVDAADDGWDEEAAEPEEAAEAPEAPEAASAEEPEPAPKAVPKKKIGRPMLPGALRRERKAWANQHGFDFAKEDSYLADEWTRGAAAGGARPRDIAHGTVFGHELFLLDLGGVNVMALRTGASSDVVVDFRRTGLPLVEEASEDLVAANEIAGFSVYATEPGVVERMSDDRLATGLEYLPEAVTAVWMENEWVLAQTDKTARSAEWDEMLAPMAVLADVARVLPPRPAAGLVYHPEQGDPTRVVPPPQPVAPTGPTAVPNPAEDMARPPVQRPEEPMVLPSRRAGAAHGSMEHRALGADEVDAIADGQERPHADESVARLPRDLGRGSSIFDEIEAELGPIGDIPEHPVRDPAEPSDHNDHQEGDDNRDA
ncbi:hypothetical protein ACEE23_02885 [Corynebacterium sp. 32222D000AT]|uniref:hypothetical protein n=1 Tax=unclassified Corynebacterium TaxID=2624378 RepID=UPI002A9D1235|nr:hypothetical protein [Mycobacteriaceae bacterium]MDY5829886.1 hypothetical protein [Corynebacterium sp.]